jgi:replicative DNA helicase
MSNITDLTLLKILCNKTTYDKYIHLINLAILDEEITLLIKDFNKYYEEFKKENINLCDFAIWFLQFMHPELPDKTKEVYKIILNRLEHTETEIAEQVILKFQELDTANKIKEKLNTFNIEEIRDLLVKHEEITGAIDKQDDGFIDNDISRILTSTSRDHGLKFRLNCLQQSLGSLIKGDFGIIAAYVDTGKTTLAISEAVYMAQQIKDGRILWLNNEEFNDRVLKKIWQSALGASWSKIEKRKEDAHKRFIEKMNGDVNRIKLIDIRNKSVQDIKTIFKRNKPKLVIIDQIDKITMKSKQFWGEHDRLKSLYGEIRSLANEYCPIIAISQADASTRWIDKASQEVKYQRYIDQSQLDGSKVGKPGEADFIITIGQDKEYPNSRFIHVSKNKLDGIDENYRKIKREVIFNGECSRYED